VAAAAFRFAIESNAPELVKAFGDIVNRQVPFAVAVALTRVAQDSRDEILGTLGEKFTLRNKRVRRGIQIQRAEKRDWPDSFALVGSRDEFMVKHETGEDKKAEKGASRVAVPTRAVTLTSSGKVPKRQKPRTIRGKPNHFISDDQTLFIRTKPKATTEGKAVPMFFLREKVEIDPVFGFEEQARTTTRRTYAAHFTRELEAAVKSAQVRAGVDLSGEVGRALWLRARRRIA
jgi:hypothetical protein